MENAYILAGCFAAGFGLSLFVFDRLKAKPDDRQNPAARKPSKPQKPAPTRIIHVDGKGFLPQVYCDAVLDYAVITQNLSEGVYHGSILTGGNDREWCETEREAGERINAFVRLNGNPNIIWSENHDV